MGDGFAQQAQELPLDSVSGEWREARRFPSIAFHYE
jgi:hypothetical protein